MKETEVISGKYKAQVEDKGANGNGAGCAAANKDCRKGAQDCKNMLFIS